MAINLLRRAADAIVARSELAQNVRSLETEQVYLKSQVDRLSTERNNMDETIRYLTAQLTEAKRKIDELESGNNRHVERIAALETNLVMRLAELDDTRRERDEAQFDLLEEREAHTATKADLDRAAKTLDTIRSVFPVPVPVPAPAPEVAAPSPFPADAQSPAGADRAASGSLPMDTQAPTDRVPPEPVRSGDPEGAPTPGSASGETDPTVPSGSPAPTSPSPMAPVADESHPWWARPTSPSTPHGDLDF